MKLSVPVNCPWGSARSCRVAPIHFQPPIGGPVSSLQVRAPLPGPMWPPAADPVCSELSCHPSEPPWGSAHSSCEAPIHFRPQLTARFRASPRAHTGPKCCCFRSWRGRPSRWASQSSARCRPPPRSSPRSPWQSHPPPASSLTCLVPPKSSCCARRQSM